MIQSKGEGVHARAYSLVRDLSARALQFCRYPAQADTCLRLAPAYRYRVKATKLLTKKLGREPTPEEITKKAEGLERKQKKKEAEAGLRI